MGKSVKNTDKTEEKSAANAAEQQEPQEQQSDVKKVRPFNVMDQMVAHRLAIEGFEILGVVPSNKYADKAHFIFTFNSNSKFKKRFQEILAEVEAAAASEASELDKLKAENEKLKAELCEKGAKTVSKSAKNVSKTGKSCGISEETYRSDMDEVRDKLAGLEALGNCILSNVAALNFYKRLHGESKEG